MRPGSINSSSLMTRSHPSSLYRGVTRRWHYNHIHQGDTIKRIYTPDSLPPTGVPPRHREEVLINQLKSMSIDSAQKKNPTRNEILTKNLLVKDGNVKNLIRNLNRRFEEIQHEIARRNPNRCSCGGFITTNTYSNESIDNEEFTSCNYCGKNY